MRSRLLKFCILVKIIMGGRMKLIVIIKLNDNDCFFGSGYFGLLVGLPGRKNLVIFL